MEKTLGAYKTDQELWEVQEALWTHPLHAPGLPTVFRYSLAYQEPVPPLHLGHAQMLALRSWPSLR